MATSSTVAFNPSVSQCIEEAYERCNVQLTSGMSLRTALFSLNILLSEWGNRGIHFWEIANSSIYINDGQGVYDIYWDSTIRNSSTTNPTRSDASSNFIYNATDILTAAYRTNSGATGQTDISLTKIDRSTYAALANKKAEEDAWAALERERKQKEKWQRVNAPDEFGRPSRTDFNPWHEVMPRVEEERERNLKEDVHQKDI